jgi:hypothetical protein
MAKAEQTETVSQEWRQLCRLYDSKRKTGTETYYRRRSVVDEPVVDLTVV